MAITFPMLPENIKFKDFETEEKPMSDKEPKVIYVNYYPDGVFPHYGVTNERHPFGIAFASLDDAKEKAASGMEKITYKVTLSDPPIFEKVDEKKMCPKGVHDISDPNSISYHSPSVNRNLFCKQCEVDFWKEQIGEIKE